MGSSISLTLWAFLGMESAAQNSAAVENPKRDVPLACMFGTLGAAVIYVLSTTVIQGIVPNAELADSTGPFGLAYAKMFNPTVGSIIMALAVLACLGSLLGWQFTIAQTGKSAADERMFPAFFTKVNSMGAPVTGMIVLGVVQTLLALSTISPTLSEQFSALVNLAVVTNVIPYIVALSALIVMMKTAKVAENVYTRNSIIAVVAMVYSVFALYASGRDAVLGGMLVLGVAYIIWGFIAPRFTSPSTASAPQAAPPATPRRRAAAHVRRATSRHRATAHRAARRRHATRRISRSCCVACSHLPARPTARPTLERIKDTGHIRFGYHRRCAAVLVRTDGGAPDGYAVELCKGIAEEHQTQLALPGLTVDWVPVHVDRAPDREFTRARSICCARRMSETLGRREHASFSIPIFAGGNRAADARRRARARCATRCRRAGRRNPSGAALRPRRCSSRPSSPSWAARPPRHG